MIFAYTVKGHGLATEGHPQNHSSLLTVEQFARARRAGSAPTSTTRGRASPTDSDAARAVRGGRAAAAPRAGAGRAGARRCPTDLGRTPAGTATTQAALGRALLDLTRDAPEAARRVVTVCPDVSARTNLGGWVNKVGVWAAREHVDWFADDPETILHWRERPDGQHLELGIAETNLVGLLGELGATWSRWGEPLLPIGVLYDPFVERALEPWSFGIYAGGQSILVGTPSGVDAGAGGRRAPVDHDAVDRAGAARLHVSYEPAFAIDVEWTLLAALARLGRPGGTSAYLRLSTRPVDQTLAAVPDRPGGPGAAAPSGRGRGLPAAARAGRARRHDRGDGRDGARGARRRGPAGRAGHRAPTSSA